MTTLETVRLEDTAFGTLASQHRLLNAVLKEPLPKAGTFGFRGVPYLLALRWFLGTIQLPPHSQHMVAATKSESSKAQVCV